MLGPVSRELITALSLNDLIDRMDKIFEVTNIERYGRRLETNFTVREFMETEKILALDQGQQRQVANLVFLYIAQIEFCFLMYGISNKYLQPADFNGDDWYSPTFRFRYGAIRQYEIVSIRAAFDVLMDILYFVDKKERIDSSKSKMKPFRKWLQNKDNPFYLFSYYLPAVNDHDQNHRTGEVHGASKIATEILRLEPPDPNDLNSPLVLFNILIGCWAPLIEILNNRKPKNFPLLSPLHTDLFFAYQNDDLEKFELEIRRHFAK